MKNIISDQRCAKCGIVRMRYGLYGKRWTLAEIGQELGITRERVRQIEKRAIEKLRRLESGEDLWKS
ncbi:sigma factor-like helix-turn-helix DNA-binding protein [Athalassotoga saccharophila]|uniref:sigma factor-like helix-turn-helix DNA-binding protein n=1 Tax=Athalassotoga saccharophila TaxID=1441386 RepID=UPI00137B2419|nr:sigma factor-like helix-turn-helix DNA-binding protein [Athalassotoga saccharophila]BBJ28536.1 RNA polymerase sigma factor RpoD [Athalassotoga saccharophila]